MKVKIKKLYQKDTLVEFWFIVPHITESNDTAMKLLAQTLFDLEFTANQNGKFRWHIELTEE